MGKRVTATRVAQVKQLARQRLTTSEISRQLGVSISTVHKIRRGVYDERCREPACNPAEPAAVGVSAWCPKCRRHVYPPCQVCRLKAYLARRPLRAPRRSRDAAGAVDPQLRERLQMPVADLGVPMRTANFLEREGILTVEDLLHCTPEELLRLPNLGAKSLRTIFRLLAQIGFHRRRKNRPGRAAQRRPGDGPPHHGGMTAE